MLQKYPESNANEKPDYRQWWFISCVWLFKQATKPARCSANLKRPLRLRWSELSFFWPKWLPLDWQPKVAEPRMIWVRKNKHVAWSILWRSSILLLDRHQAFDPKAVQVLARDFKDFVQSQRHSVQNYLKRQVWDLLDQEVQDESKEHRAAVLWIVWTI